MSDPLPYPCLLQCLVLHQEKTEVPVGAAILRRMFTYAFFEYEYTAVKFPHDAVTGLEITATLTWVVQCSYQIRRVLTPTLGPAGAEERHRSRVAELGCRQD